MLLDASVFELSGARRASSLISMCNDAFWWSLLFDEPSSNLDEEALTKLPQRSVFWRAREDDRHCRAPIVLLDGDCGSLLITKQKGARSQSIPVKHCFLDTPQQIHNLGLRRDQRAAVRDWQSTETEGASFQLIWFATNLKVTYRRQQQTALDIAKTC